MRQSAPSEWLAFGFPCVAIFVFLFAPSNRVFQLRDLLHERRCLLHCLFHQPVGLGSQTCDFLTYFLLARLLWHGSELYSPLRLQAILAMGKGQGSKT